jgi:cyanate permease
MSTAAGLAAVASPAAFGIMVDWTGNYSIPFVVSMGLAGVGIVLSFFMRPARSRSLHRDKRTEAKRFRPFAGGGVPASANV